MGLDIDFNKLHQDYEKFLEETSWYVGAQQRNLYELNYLMLGVGGEAGESVDAFKKIVRKYEMRFELNVVEPKMVMKLLDELGDVMWYYMRTLDILGVKPCDILIMNTLKLHERLNGMPTEWKITQFGKENIEWPLTSISYEGASRLMQRIETQIIEASTHNSGAKI